MIGTGSFITLCSSLIDPENLCLFHRGDKGRFSVHTIGG